MSDPASPLATGSAGPARTPGRRRARLPGPARAPGRRRARLPITARGLGALILSVAAILLAYRAGSAPLLAFGALLAVLLVGAAIIVCWPIGTLTATRSLPRSALRVGDRARIRLSLTGRAAQRLRPGIAQDRIPAAIELLADQGSEVHGNTRIAESDIRALRRGAHELGPLEISLRDPFGFFRRTLNSGGTQPLVVLPELVALTDLSALLAGERGGTGSLTVARAGSRAEDLSARPYVSGDSIRRVNWRATAHRDELMVRQEEPPGSPRALILLDISAAHWAATGDSPEHLPAFERAVSLCASAISLLAERGYRLRVRGEGGLDCVVDGRESVSGLDEALLALATVAPLPGEAALPPVQEERSSGAAESVIAVLGSLSDGEATLIAAQARDAGTAIALLPRGISPSAATILQSAGWQCRVESPGHTAGARS